MDEEYASMYSHIMFNMVFSSTTRLAEAESKGIYFSVIGEVGDSELIYNTQTLIVLARYEE